MYQNNFFSNIEKLHASMLQRKNGYNFNINIISFQLFSTSQGIYAKYDIINFYAFLTKDISLNMVASLP